MINLLPTEDKILIRREYLRRLIIVSGIFLFVLVCLAVILLLPPYFLLISQKKSFENQLDAVRQGLSREETDKIESSISDLNDKLVFFSGQESGASRINGLIKKILEARPKTVRLVGFFYQKGKEEREISQLSLQGSSLTRDVLLAFIKNLETIKEVTEVQSPPSNLLKEENVIFALIVKFKSAP